MLLVLCESCIAQLSEEQRLYQSALLEMEAKGDYQKAIELFKKIIGSQPSDRSILARTHLQLGKCYEKLGRQEAIKSYEVIITRYADQKDVASLARTRLNELKKKTKVNNDTDLIIRKLNLPIEYRNFPCPSRDGNKFAYWKNLAGNTSSLNCYDAGTRQDKQLEVGTAQAITKVCWSPDGSKIFFPKFLSADSLDVEIVHVESGNTEKLFSIRSSYIIPIDWSMNGDEVFYIRRDKNRTNHICLMNLATNNIRDLSSQYPDVVVLTDGHPRLSPDGKYYVSKVEKSGKTQMKIFATDGSASVTLRDTLYATKYPLWSVDGKYILYAGIREGINDLMMVRVADGKPVGEPRLLKSDIGASVTLREVSKSGKLYYEQRLRWQTIVSFEIDTMTLQLKSQPTIHGESGSNNSLSRWSPSGSAMYYFSQRLSSPRKIGGSLPWGLFMSPGHEQNVEEIDLGAYQPYYFIATPDSEYIFFDVDNPISVRGIYAYSFRKKEIKKITLNSEFECSTQTWRIVGWRSSSNELLVACGIFENDRRTCVYRFNVNNPVPYYLTEFEGETPVLSPDGNEFLYIHNRKGTIEIKSLTTDSVRVLHRRADPKAMFAWPSWSSDGRRIIYRYGIPGATVSDIRSVPASGGEEIIVFKGTPEYPQPYYASWSPDGRRIAFTVLLDDKRDLWVMENFLPK